MTHFESELRKLITEARDNGRSLKSITDEAGVGYFKLYNFLSGRSPAISVTLLDRVYRSLGGTGFTQ